MLKLIIGVLLVVNSFSLSAKEALNEEKSASATRAIFKESYKKIVVLMKDVESSRSGDFLILSADFLRLAKYKNIEKVTKIKREWFERVGAGLEFMQKFKAEMRIGERRKDLKRYERGKVSLSKTHTKLIELIKSRKTEYSIKK